MFLVELIASSFRDLISKQARPECRCKRVLVPPISEIIDMAGFWVPQTVYRRCSFADTHLENDPSLLYF